MFKVSIFAVILVGLSGALAATSSAGPQAVSVKMVSSGELKQLLEQYPDAQPLKMSKNSRAANQERQQVYYTLGDRVSGDRLVGSNSGGQTWSSPQNVQFSFMYPASGDGAVISYVGIDVNQSSNLGQAYVTNGGIGQRTITIIVVALNTNWFNYTIYIFGR